MGLLTWLGVLGFLLQPWQMPAWQTQTPRHTAKLTSASESNLNTPGSSELKQTLSKLPLRFESNRGQTDQAVRFISRGQGYTLYLMPSEARFELLNKTTNTRSAIGLKLVGASSVSTGEDSAIIEGIERLPARSNYFIGNNSKEWRTDIPTFARVRQRNVYPGIDVVFYGNQQQIEYDFVVAPYANPQQIKLAFDNADQIQLEENGSLRLSIGAQPDEQLRIHKPIVYQETNGERHEIEGRYLMTGGGSEETQVAFELGKYDPSLPLIIDPVVEYATYFGGSGFDIGYGIAVDQQGFVYVTGQTASLDFPTKNAFRTARDGASDAFLMKLNPTGSSVIFSTYIGGRNPDDKGAGIAVDRAGNIYFAGETNSLNFPTANAAQPTNRGNTDAFIAKFNIDGNELIYSTFWGGTLPDAVYGIALDRFDNAYVTGQTESTNFPARNALQSTIRGQRDAFIAKFNPDGAVVYSTYLGGDIPPNSTRDDEAGYGIAVDQLQNAYITGFTSSPSFPMVNALQRNFAGVEDVFVAKINAAGSALVYSTFLGGERGEEAKGIAVDALGNAYITGYTFSLDFPTTANALQRIYGGNVDGFVTKINAAGSGLIYSTFLGGNGAENTGLISDITPVGSIAVDKFGNAYVTGRTESANFPVVRAIQPSLRGDNDIFLSKLDPSGSELIYSTYLGSSFTGDNGFDERGLDIKVDGFGNAYLTGQILKNDFMTVTPVQPNFGGGLSDAFITKVSTRDIPTISAVSAASFTGASLAASEIVTVFGANLASGVLIASTVPLPTSLLGVTVKVKDRIGTERLAPLFFVSPEQINFQMPAGTVEGKATITVTTFQSAMVSTIVLIEKTAPGLFAANANGQDVAAAVLLRVKSDGRQIFEPIAQFNDQNKLVSLPIDFGDATDQLFLILFGTGWRGRSAQEKVTAQISGINTPVTYAGEQGSFIGEDQINLQLPRTLAGRGTADIVVTVDGQFANLVTVAFR